MNATAQGIKYQLIHPRDNKHKIQYIIQGITKEIDFLLINSF